MEALLRCAIHGAGLSQPARPNHRGSRLTGARGMWIMGQYSVQERNEAMLAYIAGPLFNEGERWFDEQINALAEAAGFVTFLPASVMGRRNWPASGTRKGSFAWILRIWSARTSWSPTSTG